MNKNLLLIAGAVAAYALLRPKSTSTTTAATSSPSTGASAYVPTTPPNTTVANSGSNWLTAAGNILSQGTALVTQGSSAFDQIKGALHIGTTTSNATTTATGDVWAGPSTATSIWAGPQYQTS